MPKPNPGESKSEYVSRCVKVVMGEGADQQAALGKCYGMWESYAGKSVEGEAFNASVGESIEREKPWPDGDPGEIEADDDDVSSMEKGLDEPQVDPADVNVAFPNAPEDKLQARREKAPPGGLGFPQGEYHDPGRVDDAMVGWYAKEYELSEVSARSSLANQSDAAIAALKKKMGGTGGGQERDEEGKFASKELGENGAEMPKMPEEDMMAGKAEETEPAGGEEDWLEVQVEHDESEPEEEEPGAAEKEMHEMREMKEPEEEPGVEKGVGGFARNPDGTFKLGTGAARGKPGYTTHPGKGVEDPEADKPPEEGVEKARSVGGFESPEPGDRSESDKAILAAAYASARKKGYDKTRASKIAWGAVHNAHKSQAMLSRTLEVLKGKFAATDEFNEDTVGEQIAHLGPVAGEIRKVVCRDQARDEEGKFAPVGNRRMNPAGHVEEKRPGGQYTSIRPGESVKPPPRHPEGYKPLRDQGKAKFTMVNDQGKRVPVSVPGATPGFRQEGMHTFDSHGNKVRVTIPGNESVFGHTRAGEEKPRVPFKKRPRHP